MDPYYEPWQGSLFNTSPFGDVRLLIVGESSYERDEKSTPITSKSIQGMLRTERFPQGIADSGASFNEA